MKLKMHMKIENENENENKKCSSKIITFASILLNPGVLIE